MAHNHNTTAHPDPDPNADFGFYYTAAVRQGMALGCHLDLLDSPYSLSAVGGPASDGTGRIQRHGQLRLWIIHQPGDVVLFLDSVYEYMTEDGEGARLDNRLVITFFFDNETVCWAGRMDNEMAHPPMLPLQAPGPCDNKKDRTRSTAVSFEQGRVGLEEALNEDFIRGGRFIRRAVRCDDFVMTL